MKKSIVIFFVAVLSTLSCKITEEHIAHNMDCDQVSNEHVASLQLDEIIENAVTKGLVGAAVIIDSESRGIYQKAMGLADLETGTPLLLCHQFRVASLTKIFTAAATLILVEEGKISLDTYIKPYLKTEIVDGILGLETVKVRQLLNHTSGIPNYDSDFRYAPLILNNPGKDLPLQQKLSLIKGKNRTPEWVISKFGQIYSNSNYLILQLIIEQASGMFYEDFVIERIIEPFGLSQTTFGNKERYPENLAVGYVDFYGDGTMRNVNDWDADRFDAEGDLISTVSDIMLFYQTLLNGNMISDELLAAMKDTRLGLLQEQFNLENAIGHDGIGIGYSAELWYLEKSKLTIVLLSNQGRLVSENWSVLKFENLLRDLIKAGR